jgi:DNA mismatch repair protein MutL
MLNLDPKLVDVNVHPRKTEVRFIDPGGVFQLISSVIRQTLSGSKIIS